MNLSKEARESIRRARRRALLYSEKYKKERASEEFKKATGIFRNIAVYFEKAGGFNRVDDGFGGFSSLADSYKGTSFLRSATASVMTGGVDTAFLLYSKSVTIGFSKIQSPAFQGLSSMTGGIYDVLLNPMVERELIAQQFRMMEISSMRLASVSIIGQRLIPSLVNSIRLSKSAGLIFSARLFSRQLLERSFGFLALRFGSGLLRRFGIRASAGLLARIGTKFIPGVGFVSLAADAVSLYIFLNNYFRQKRNSELNQKFAESKGLVDLFNPAKNVEIYRNNMSLLMASGSNDFSTLVGYGREESSFVDNVYGSSKLNLLDMGVSSEDIIALGSELSRTTTVSFDQLDELTGMIFDYSSVFYGGNTKMMTGIMSSIISAIPTSENTISLAEKAFEDFFAAVVGEGKPQGAHLQLVQALAQFSSEYGMYTRLNDNATEEIARIHQFMSDDGFIAGRFDATATETAIKTADNTLLNGFVSGNITSRAILRNAGLTQYEAIRGVTSDAEFFERFLASTLYTMGVRRTEVPKEGEVASEEFSNKFKSLVYELGINIEETNALLLALRQYASGRNIEEVRQDFADSSGKGPDTPSPPGGKSFLQAYADFSSNIIRNVTVSRNLLMSVVDANMEIISAMQLGINDLFINNADYFGRAAAVQIDTIMQAMRVNSLVQKSRVFELHASSVLEALSLSPSEVYYESIKGDFTEDVANRAVYGAGGLVESYTSNAIRDETGYIKPSQITTYEDFLDFFKDADITPLIASIVEENNLWKYLKGSASEGSYNNGIITDVFLDLLSSELNSRLYLDEEDNQSSPSSSSSSGYVDVVGGVSIDSPSVTGTGVDSLMPNQSIYNTIYSNLSDYGGYSSRDEEGNPFFNQGFFREVSKVSEELGISLDELLALMYFETGGTFSPNVRPDDSELAAIGLIQFTPTGVRGLKSLEDFSGLTLINKIRELGVEGQIDLMKEYFEYVSNFPGIKSAGGLSALSLSELYLTIFAPGVLSNALQSEASEDYTVYSKKDNPTQYDQNQGFDVNKNDKISISEISNKVMDVYRNLFNKEPDSGGSNTGTRVLVKIPVVSSNPQKFLNDFAVAMG